MTCWFYQSLQTYGSELFLPNNGCKRDGTLCFFLVPDLIHSNIAPPRLNAIQRQDGWSKPADAVLVVDAFNGLTIAISVSTSEQLQQLAVRRLYFRHQLGGIKRIPKFGSNMR